MFVVVSKALAPRIRKALARLEGLPARGVWIGGSDCSDPTTPGPGWTTDAVDEGDDDGTSVCIELSDRLQKWCGRTVVVSGQSITLPTVEQLKDEASLPVALQLVRQAKREAAQKALAAKEMVP